uniref:Phytanoyl-CoA hydroxylase-interacting protein-like C-terminal domain-containing protein n=1 Tax=Plectus sambesii TaxID=2011161 RepID=A0A914X1T7_9BILA
MLVFWKKAIVLSRVEPKEDYDKILNNDKHPGIEQPYIKNSNGHSWSLINGQIHGLFMSAGSVGSSSPFGDVCYEYKIKDLLKNIFDYHLYFADFYCPKNSPNHKLTLVRFTMH